jgi:glucoamylase
LHAGVRIVRAAPLCAIALAVGVLLVSGGSDSDPRTPPALPGLPPPFLGTAVSGDGGLTAAVDAYGDVVDLRPGPAGAALIDNPSDRQAAGTVPEDTGIVPRVSGKPMWRADSVSQRYLAGTSVVRTVARFGGTRIAMTTAAAGRSLAVVIRDQGNATLSVSVNVASGVHCARERRAALLDLTCRLGRVVPPIPAAAAVIRSATENARAWLNRSRPLGTGASAWMWSMYERSLLTLHALTSRRTGAVAAGARDGWAYVWPRDASTAALALAASGHHAEARHVARFLTDLDLSAAARFTEAGTPVPGRAAQGDAAGWVTAAARATGVPAPHERYAWQDRADYQESAPGTYLGNALAAAGSDVDGPKTGLSDGFSAHQLRGFETARGLARTAGDPGSGLDSAAGWAVRPFRLTALYPAAERTLLRLVHDGTPYGITPGEGWTGGEDPWTAPTAWSAWALAGLAAEPHGPGGRGTRTNLPVREGGSPSRRSALWLVRDLRRAATPAGDLPERVGAHTGIPTSTTPLLWSSAFTVLALRELWP